MSTANLAAASASEQEEGPRSAPKVIAVGLGLAALLTLLVAAFTWPPSELEPRSLPLVVAGPPAAIGPVKAQLAQAAGDDAFDVTAVADRGAAVKAIEDREAYGAIVVGADGPEVLTASAAGAQVAQMLTQQAATMGENVQVSDVVAAPKGDPRGLVFGSGAFPLAVGGIMVGAVTSLALRRTRDRVAAALVVGIAGGLAMTAVLQYGLDALGGTYVVNAGVVGLAILAVALPIVGLRHIIGPAGIGIMALLILLVGNPLSGITSAPELLPLGWLGQLLPPGAAGNALRGTAFFDDAGIGAPLVVLGTWALVGLVLTLVPRKEGQPQVAAA